MKIVTGRTGKPHVTSEDDRLLQQAIWKEDGIFAFEPSKMVDANTFRAMPINILFQGCHARILPGEYEDLRIDSGEAGKKRYDLIVARYEIDTDGIESIRLVVIKGTAVPTSGTAVMPSYITGDINKGATIADMLLWEIPITGINVGTPVLKCTKLLGLKDKITKGESYTKTESDKTTEAIYTRIDSTERSIESLSTSININANNISAVEESASAAKSAADAALVKANDAKTSATKAAKIAATGRVILGTQRHTFKFTESGGGVTVGDTDIFTFNAPTGTNGVFGVVKSLSKLCEFLSYSYTLEDGTCTFTVNGLNSATSQGSIEMVIICIGPASQGITS